MSMEAPTWDVIGHSLKLLLSKYDLDLNNIGMTQRIDYKDFEQIFYHLFFIIDPADTKRKFWSFYPSKYPEEQAKFIETALQMINVKQLSPYRASLAQLKMLGGDPFRRLLGSLIEKAAECEIQHILKRCPGDIEIDSNLDSNMKRLGALQERITNRLPEFKHTLSKYGPLQENLYNINLEMNVTLESLIKSTLGVCHGSDSDVKTVKEIFKSILARLEKTSLRQNVMHHKVNQILVPIEDSFESSSLPASKQNTSRRISEYFKEMREFLALSPECDKGSNKSKTLNNVSERLMRYDDGVESLVNIWEDEQERSEAALAEIPEMRQRYEYFEKLIPRIYFSPITLDKRAQLNL